MRRLGNINPTVRGLLIIAAIALTVMVLQLWATLLVVGMLLRIAFFLAMAYFIFLMWRERRGEIEQWPARAKIAFYGAAALIVADLAIFFAPFRTFKLAGFPAFAFIVVLIVCGYSMWRIWRDQHTYG